jgi:predicted kinase
MLAKLFWLSSWSSPDKIYKQLYGDKTIKAVWLEIEEKVICEIREAIAQGCSVIYDATNAKRGWRTTAYKRVNTNCKGLVATFQMLICMG